MERIFLYIIECSDDYLYVGITTNLSRRMSEHRKGLCRNTKNRGIIKLVYTEKFDNIHKAASREKEIKGWRREKKDFLIQNRACSEQNRACSEQSEEPV